MISFPSLNSQVLRDGVLMPAWARMLLDVVTSVNRFAMPSLTTTQRDALTPVAGMMVYNTTTDKAQVYQAGAWVDLV